MRGLVVVCMLGACRLNFDAHGDASADDAGLDAPADAGPPGAGVLVQTHSPSYVRAAMLTTQVAYGAGHLLVVVEYWNRVVANTISISDTSGLTWLNGSTGASVPSGCDEGGGVGQRLLYAITTTTAITDITVAQSDTNNYPLGFYVAEYANIDVSSDPIDSFSEAPASSASSIATTSATLSSGTPTQAIAAFTDTHNAGAMTAIAPWRRIDHDDGFYGILVDQFVPQAVTWAPAANLAPSENDACWVASAASFRTKI